ncbi:TPA: DUF550 domain-containing protein [Klebsiella quasipneumoniae]
MNKKHLTREALLKIIETDQAQCGETSDLACIVLAAIDNGISLTRNIVPEEMNIGTAMKFWGGGRGSIESFVAGYNFCRAAILRAQSAQEREQIRQEHAEWSQSTFGNVGPIGPLKHLSKEALEAAEQPSDLSEWADMQFLLWDAQRRAGITDEQITHAMIEKLAVNKKREWPEPKDGEPRLHINKQSALVLPEEITLEKVAEMTAARGAEYSIRDGIIAAKWWNACRTAMLQAGTLTNEGTIQAVNSPVIPDGYVMVPKEPTKEILDEFDSIIDYGAEDSVDAWSRLLAAAPQEVK